MTFSSRVGLLSLTALAGLILAGIILRVASFIPVSAAVDYASETAPTPLPDQPVAVDAPEISSIYNPSPACVLPQKGTGECFISWYYLYAISDPAYMITMTVDIDEQPRARYQGFFQTSMYVPAEMLVFQVACGAPGSGGDPQWGLAHKFKIRGKDSSGNYAENTGQVFCPADLVNVYLPSVYR